MNNEFYPSEKKYKLPCQSSKRNQMSEKEKYERGLLTELSKVTKELHSLRMAVLEFLKITWSQTDGRTMNEACEQIALSAGMS